MAHFLDQDDRGFLIEHLVDSHHAAQLHQRLMTSAAFTDILCASCGDSDGFRVSAPRVR